MNLDVDPEVSFQDLHLPWRVPQVPQVPHSVLWVGTFRHGSRLVKCV
jgi:hypothetical protein